MLELLPQHVPNSRSMKMSSWGETLASGEYRVGGHNDHGSAFRSAASGGRSAPGRRTVGRERWQVRRALPATPPAAPLYLPADFRTVNHSPTGITKAAIWRGLFLQSHGIIAQSIRRSAAASSLLRSGSSPLQQIQHARQRGHINAGIHDHSISFAGDNFHAAAR